MFSMSPLGSKGGMENNKGNNVKMRMSALGTN
jgi:hypothetical protein